MAYRYLTFSVAFLLLTACETYNPLQDFDPRVPARLPELRTVAAGYPEQQVAHGEYLVTLLACGTCHTDGALVGNPDPARQFAGSRIGIAYSNPFENRNPGILYPANITPDVQTGIGAWSDASLHKLLRTGVDASGNRHLPVMPWPAYAKLSDEDAESIVAFLRSLEPIKHSVPNNVPAGTRATAPYVHFGVYQSKR